MRSYAYLSHMTYAMREVSDDVARRLIERYRVMSPAEKLALADSVWDVAWDATKADMRMRQPTLSEPDMERAASSQLRRAHD
ncbi:hypothetical protein BH11GEM2_BH11GEM2_13190 [soil metagenome]